MNKDSLKIKIKNQYINCKISIGIAYLILNLIAI